MTIHTRPRPFRPFNPQEETYAEYHARVQARIQHNRREAIERELRQAQEQMRQLNFAEI